MMDHTEQLVRAAAGDATVTYQGKPIDFGKPFARLPIPEAIRKQRRSTGDLRDRALPVVRSSNALRCRTTKSTRAGARCS